MDGWVSLDLGGVWVGDGDGARKGEEEGWGGVR